MPRGCEMPNRNWLASYGEKISAAIDPDAHRSVVELLESPMARYADKPAFRCCGQALRFAAVDRLSRAFAAYLQQKLGVAKGDRVAVMMPNVPAFPLACIGILRAGAVQVNVNPLYTPRELEHQLKDSGAGIIVISNGCSATLAEVIARTPIERVISVALADGTAAAVPSPSVDARLQDVIGFADALAEGAGLAFEPGELNGAGLLFLQSTGGTTGRST